MELLFKQLKQRFPLRYFYGENVPEGAGSTHNNFQPTSKSLIIKSDITELRSYLHATFGKQILIISEL